jgi:DNA helicase-2/ATP-dependent DNA helicase PcrA
MIIDTQREFLPTEADKKIEMCLKNNRSFSVIAGAGSGKTTSLVEGLRYLREEHGKELHQNGQRVVCITYTNRAVDVITSRLGFDDLFLISTLHGFLWSEIKKFQTEIRESLRSTIIPAHIEKAAEKDTGKQTKTAIRAREKIENLNQQLIRLDDVNKFEYDDNTFSNFDKGEIGHDDVIDLASDIILSKPLLRRGLGLKYPYFFVDEAQDTFDTIVAAFNAICEGPGLPIIGYFGDPMQQIYENGSGTFLGPEGFATIPKEENFRSARSIVSLTNAFRDDLQQVPAGKNSKMEGSVLMTLVQAETPAGERKRYTLDQIDRALNRFDQALEKWGWTQNENAKRLFLVRQMIARRLGFSLTNSLFNGTYASTKAKKQYEDGDHFLLKPFVTTICPLVTAHKAGNSRTLVEILKDTSPAFDVNGENKDKSLKEMLATASDIVGGLSEVWKSKTTKDVLLFSQEHKLCSISDRLANHLKRGARDEEFNADINTEEKEDWLCDAFFEMTTDELTSYSDFVQDNTPLSTQHGSKGEEYEDVLVVFDDIEAAWNQYSFTKLLTPGISGGGTEGQQNRSRKLAYVCFSRAQKNLRILLFTPDALTAKAELIGTKFFTENQITILS